MKAQMVIPTLAALAGALWAGVAVQPAGDSSANLRDFEQKLEAAFLRKAIYASGAAGEKEPPCVVRLAGQGRSLLIGFVGRSLADAPPDGHCSALSKSDLDALFGLPEAPPLLTTLPANLPNTIRTVTQIAPRWREVEPLCDTVSSANRNIAVAKALLRYDEPPGRTSGSVWEQRRALAARPWKVEEPWMFAAKAAAAVVAGLGGGFLLAFLALALSAWAWRFLLARIRGLSSAVGGK